MQNGRGPFGRDFIDTVKSANSIVDVARSYMTMKQKGRDFWACCPFHHEKTPSFKVSAGGQSYYCFGCKAHGNVIGLIMQLENLSWREAVEFLAKRANIEIPKIAADDESIKTARKRERMLTALLIARDYYCKTLYKKENIRAVEYLHGRGIDDELIKLFHIGYSDSWQGVVDELKRNNFTENEMHDAGIVAKNDKGRVWDAQFERITFSIHDIYGNCIGFTGRTMSSADNLAKYKNTADSLVFNKSNIVYGIDVMKQKYRESKADGLIIVEGNVDEIAMVKNGFVNTVACMGTAMTQFHAKIFARFSDQIYLCLDGDSAGQKAILRSIPILEKELLSVRVAAIPDGLDPDDYLKKFGPDKMRSLINNAVSAADFRLDYLAKNTKIDDNIGKAKYIKDAIKILSEFDTPAERELYLPKVAAVAGVPVDSIRGSLPRQKGKKQLLVDSNIIETTTGSGGVNTAYLADADTRRCAPAYNKAQWFVTACIIEKKPFVSMPIDLPKLNNALYDKLCRKALENYDKWTKGNIYEEFAGEDLKNLENVIEYSFDKVGGIDKQKETFLDDLRYLWNAEIENEIAELSKNITDPVAYAKKIKELKGKRK